MVVCGISGGEGCEGWRTEGELGLDWDGSENEDDGDKGIDEDVEEDEGDEIDEMDEGDEGD